MQTLNLGILAHVDAGKTSLTERLLFSAGVIDRIGSVDSGNTQTDTLALERQRGITIKAAVVSFMLGDVAVNLIDTPGHPDFIAEVERTLGVLDGAVLVVSSVEGVQAQTRVLMRALQRLGIPTLIFVNKIDRRGARCEEVFAAIRERLAAGAVAMGTVAEPGSRAAAFVPFAPDDPAFRATLIEALSETDETILADFVAAPERLTARRLHEALRREVAAARLQPVFFGSAISGAGSAELMAALATLLPATPGDDDAPLSGTVFKIDRGWSGDKVAYLRLFSGHIRARGQVMVRGVERRVTSIQLFDGGRAEPAPLLGAGRIGRVTGLGDVRIGDIVGAPPPRGLAHHFAPPTLETRILPRRPSDAAALWQALGQLAEQDPLINLRKNDEQQQIFVSLYGEVQKEVIGSTLETDFGIAVDFEKSTIICVERLLGIGEAAEYIFRAPNPYLATLGLRVEPRPPETGATFSFEVDIGQMPAGFYRAVEEAVHETLRQGMEGWQMVDCHVAMVASGQSSPTTTATDFRELTPLVLAAAIRQAGTQVCEPVQHFRLDLPASSLGAILPLLAQAGGVLRDSRVEGETARLSGEIPAAGIHRFQEALPGLTGGEGILEAAFDHYRPVSGTPPHRPRTGPDPFDRAQYLHRVRRKLAISGEAPS